MAQKAGTRLAAARAAAHRRQPDSAFATEEVPNRSPARPLVGLVSETLGGDMSEGPSDESRSHHKSGPTGRSQLAHETGGALASSRRLLFIFTSLFYLFIAPHEAFERAQRPKPVVSSAYSSFGAAHFPSARHFYHSSASAPPTSAPTGTTSPEAARLRKRDRISSLHEQLNQLRRQLETELRVGDTGESDAKRSQSNQTNAEPAQLRPLVQLGAPCLNSAHCAESIRNSHCSAANFTCVCLHQHVPINASTCLAPALLGYECQLDAQCQQKVAHSLCLSNKCACPPHAFVAHRKNKCLAASKLNDFCLSDQQCQLEERHSFCKWRIPNVYGTCKCPPNYKLLTLANSTRCAPRLGDACFSDAECQLATANSICRPPAAGSASRGVLAQLAAIRQGGLSSSWPTSSASSWRCGCGQGFVWSASQLECEAAPKKPPPSTTTTAAAAASGTLQDSHKYEMIVIPTGGQQQAAAGHSNEGLQSDSASRQQWAADEQLEIKTLDSGRRPTTPSSASAAASPTPSAASGSTTTTARSIPVESNENQPSTTMRPQTTGLRMSSLGKSCGSRAECQLRDPHSDCIGGRCECQMPTARCGANSTGCHKDTFQCRNGQCISWYFVCDQFPNCDDASDELDCQPNGCPRESFQCQAGGACVARAKLCDGKRDCPDASDERHCQTLAATNSISLNQQQQQQQQQHRLSLSASSNSSTLAAGAPASCHPDAFSCRNGRQCLPAYVFCNAVVDCDDASDEDELLCERPRAQRKWLEHLERELANRKSTTTPPDSLQMDPAPGGGHGDELRPPPPADESPLVKTDRASIERLRAALALAKRTPEARGRPQGQRRAKLLDDQPAARPPDECPRWAFTCANGKCRSSAILCSGVDGCGDNSDEDRCEVCHCQPPAPASRPAK